MIMTGRSMAASSKSVNCRSKGRPATAASITRIGTTNRLIWIVELAPIWIERSIMFRRA